MKRTITLCLVFALMLSLSACGARKANEMTAAALAAADMRRESIKESATDIVPAAKHIPGKTYNGTAYYISNSGSDDNNGLAPETAFATVDALRGVSLSPGDAVFFERGGLWRAPQLAGSVRGTSGLTFSAYGEGEKPRLYASPENGGGAEKWTLYHEGENGELVWAFYREMTEVAGIVLGGAVPVARDTAYWNGSSFFEVDEFNMATPARYAVEDDLPDMRCFPMLNYTHSGAEFPVFMAGWDAYDLPEYITGTLYFRCDAGNPGELYADIEFISPYWISDGFSDDTVYDNLCIRYSSGTLTTGSYGGIAPGGCRIQNCEIGWMGGHVAAFATGLEEGDTRVSLNDGAMGRMGGCVSINGSNIYVLDNYIHHGFDEGVAMETFIGDPGIYGNVISGNLVESCVQSLLICNWDMEVVPEHIITDCVFEDNLVLFSGRDNWENDERYLNDVAAIKLQGGPCANEGLIIRNNTFAFSENDLIIVDVYSEEYSAIFEGNTYIQTIGLGLLKTNEPATVYYGASEKEVSAALGDDTAVFAAVKTA